jgi:hypothetical protein
MPGFVQSRAVDYSQVLPDPWLLTTTSTTAFRVLVAVTLACIDPRSTATVW